MALNGWSIIQSWQQCTGEQLSRTREDREACQNTLQERLAMRKLKRLQPHLYEQRCKENDATKAIEQAVELMTTAMMEGSCKDTGALKSLADSLREQQLKFEETNQLHTNLADWALALETAAADGLLSEDGNLHAENAGEVSSGIWSPEQVEGRWAKWRTYPGAVVLYKEGPVFDEVCLSANSTSFSRNSVILLPNLLSVEERRFFMEAADAAAVERTGDMLRFSVLDKSGGLGCMAAELWQSVMGERVLPFATHLSQEWEGVLHSEVKYAVSQSGISEPTVNRYGKGGHFPKHIDEMAVSVICQLNNKGFEGGGTDYWAEHPSEEVRINGGTKHAHPTLRLHAGPGVGIVFHGQLSHSGVAVESGTRYVLVASFQRENAVK